MRKMKGHLGPTLESLWSPNYGNTQWHNSSCLRFSSAYKILPLGDQGRRRENLSKVHLAVDFIKLWPAIFSFGRLWLPFSSLFWLIAVPVYSGFVLHQACFRSLLLPEYLIFPTLFIYLLGSLITFCSSALLCVCEFASFKSKKKI